MVSCYIEQHKELLTNIKYYGEHDFSSGFFAKNVIDNLDTLEKEPDSLNPAVNDLISLYQYLWTYSFKRFVQDIDCFTIDDATKNKIKKLDKQIKQDDKSFILYVNNNYQIIFSKDSHTEVKWYSIYSLLLELIYDKFSGGIAKDVYLFLEKNLYLTLLSKFEICKTYYSKQENNESFESLFLNLEKTKNFDDKVYLDFLFRTKANFKYDFLKDKAKFICERALINIKNIKINSDDEEVLQVAYELDEYFKLASLFKLECISQYSVVSAQMKRLLNDYLSKHGQKMSLGQIDLSPAINFLKNEHNEFKFMRLTHVFKNNEFENLCNHILTLKNDNNPSEIFSELGNPRSEKYPYYKQHDMELSLHYYVQIMICVFCDENLSVEFSKYIQLACNQVEKLYFNNEINLSSEIFGSFEILENIITLYKNKQDKDPLTKALENGCTLNLCATIEKIIRNILIKEVDNTLYIDPDAITLVQILNPSNKLSDVSKGLRYYLEFYLATEIDFKGLKQERPGKNIRNVQMHNRNDKYENTNYQISFTLFFFLMSLLDDLLAVTASDK